MSIISDIKVASDNTDGVLETIGLWYKVFIALVFCIPLLYIVGLLIGILMFKNPHMAGTAVVKGVF